MIWCVWININGSSYTWAQALSNGKQQAYLAYYDSSSASLSERKYKYLSTESGLDDTAFRNKKGYWLYANQSGNLTLLGVGGSTSGQSYSWSKLRFMNSSGSEMNVTDAGINEWVGSTLKIWNVTSIHPITKVASYGFVDIASGNLNSWKGYFIWSNYDNITLLRQN